MTGKERDLGSGLVVEEEIHLTLVELCQASRVPEQEIRAWVVEGVLDPEGATPEEWRFVGASLRRARTALRLSRDLEVNLAGIALALDLLDEITLLKSRLASTRSSSDPPSTILVE
ncbi:MAG TPA: chaperone modulator CbpM [Vicinamibacteria bacterium]|nr:chaperone modulator CbpM [Vicinamibacteria bacterium]HRB13792.1 chaperone modulator CbpM [Vicinamibacteria bacterium]